MSSPVEQYNDRFVPKESEPEAPAPRLVASWDYAKGMALAREIIAAGGIDVLGEKTAPSGDHVFMLKQCPLLRLSREPTPYPSRSPRTRPGGELVPLARLSAV